MLAQSLRYLVQQRIVRSRSIVTDQVRNLAIEVAHDIRGGIGRRAKLPVPQIREQWIGFIRPALLITVSLADLCFLLGSIGNVDGLVDNRLLRQPRRIRGHLRFDTRLKRSNRFPRIRNRRQPLPMLFLCSNQCALCATEADQDLVKLCLVRAHEIQRTPFCGIEAANHLVAYKGIKPNKSQRLEAFSKIKPQTLCLGSRRTQHFSQTRLIASHARDRALDRTQCIASIDTHYSSHDVMAPPSLGNR